VRKPREQGRDRAETQLGSPCHSWQCVVVYKLGGRNGIMKKGQILVYSDNRIF
jgi:hypothetical protein